MRDGDIIDGKAWFGFDVHDLYWLLDYIPRSDGFREDVKDAIKKLEPDGVEIPHATQEGDMLILTTDTPIQTPEGWQRVK